MNSKMKATLFFAAGMAFGEFVLRWFIHGIYICIIGVLLLR